MEPLEHNIRYLEASDLKPLKEWLMMPGELYGYPMCDRDEVDAFANVCVSYGKHKASITATINENGKERPVGVGSLFLLPYKKLFHHSGAYLMIDPKVRGRGIEQSMIKNLKHLGKNYFKLEQLHFEQVEDSPLIPFLLESGFRQIFKQDGFFLEGDKMYAREMYECDLEKEQI